MEGRKQSLKELTRQVLWLVSRQKCLGTKHCVRGGGGPSHRPQAAVRFIFASPDAVFSQSPHICRSPSRCLSPLLNPSPEQCSCVQAQPKHGFKEAFLSLVWVCTYWYRRPQPPDFFEEYLSNIQNVSKEKSSPLSFMVAHVSSGSLWSGPSVKCRAGAGQY